MALRLTSTERRALQETARSDSREARRARVILLLARGEPYAAICARLGCHPDFINRWRRRFEENRVAGLRTRPARRVDMATATRRVLERLHEPPPAGMSRWTTRALGRAVGLSHTIVARVLRQEGLGSPRTAPWRSSSAPGVASGDSPDARARLEPIWQRLLAFGAAETDAALLYALRTFGELVGAHDAYWLGAVRLNGVRGRDPLDGWRPRAFRDLPAEHDRDPVYRRFRRDVERQDVDELTVALVQRAGEFRAARLRELMPPAWFDSSYFHDTYGWQGIVDGVIVAVPVSADAESYWGWHRHQAQGPFTAEERDRLAFALRGVPWLDHRVMLSYGPSTHVWPLHVGDSFTDVPPSHLFYGSIETVLHHGVTGGCVAEAYCPGERNTRGQLPVFLLRAVEGPDVVPPPCVDGDEAFTDVPFDSPFCPWIEELAERGVTSGCGGDEYCPQEAVTRAQMSIYLLKTLLGEDYAPEECDGVFDDVPCPSLFAAWIEDLAARGITIGCSATEYCPAAPVNRGQMAVFVARTFGLTLYGP